MSINSDSPESDKNTDKDKNKWIRYVGIGLLILLCLFLLLFFAVYMSFHALDIQVDEKNLCYEEAAGYYYLTDDFESFEGEISGLVFLLKSISYEITDANGVIVASGEATCSDGEWQIKEPGMMLGVNTLQITGKTLLGTTIDKAIRVINADTAFQEYVDIDLDDSDEDGLIDYYEAVLGTDSSNPDTDGDGLSDYVESVYTNTDPLSYSTNEDGICDADRDSDSDGLSNLYEVELGLDPGVSDTDGDELSDGDEINIYFTDPLVKDTDNDGATDGWEVENGYNPLESDEVFEAVAQSVAENSDVTASVTLQCSENPQTLYVEPISISGLIDDAMLGYLGSAYSFNYSGDFISATIAMTFDETVLDEGAEPTIYYFNAVTQVLEEVDTTVEGNVATAEVTHFSTYILLDRVRVNRVIGEEIISPSEVADAAVNVAFVIDYSASMDDNDPDYIRLEIVKQYIEKLRDGVDSAAVIKFAGYATTLVPLTTDKEMLTNAVDGITNTGADSCSYLDAGTNGTDGLRNAINALGCSSGTSYKYIIFLTDGEDTTSSYSYEDLILEAIGNNIIIYTIGLGDCDEDLLYNIATATGGKYHYASVVEDGSVLSLEDAIGEIEAETIDLYADSNNDGISDYYTKLICEGILTTGTGTNPFGEATYDEIQEAGSDFDGDGLANGDEIRVVESDGYVYLFYESSPIEKDTDGDGYTDEADENPMSWDVGDRDLAIFAALAYEDGSGFIGSIYKASQIVGGEDESGESYYFLNYASIGEKDKDYAIVENWIIVDYVNELASIDFFSATTYKCQDNIVIAFRGTSETTEWIDNIVGYGLSGYHSEEYKARNYVQKIAYRYPDCKIYITGHSLGGYLAQIGTAELLENTEVMPERVAYFNGIGMNFIDYTGVSYLIRMGSTVGRISLVLAQTNAYFHLEDMDYLSEYATSGNLISYEIAGDIVSALGTHCGQEIVFEAAAKCLDNHSEQHGTGTLQEFIGNAVIHIFGWITLEELYSYYDYYESKSITEYLWVTHETDSFYYYLHQGTR